MKKTAKKDREQKRKPRRLSLNRETIRSLNDPAVLEHARGGTAASLECPSDILGECHLSNYQHGCETCQTTSMTSP